MMTCDTSSQRLSDHSRGSLRLAVILCALVAGCRGLDATAWKPTTSYDRTAELRPNEPNPLQKVTDRFLGKEPAASYDPAREAAGRREFEQAKTLYDAGKYAEAEDEFERVAKRYENSPVREDALFYVAESRFARKRYSWAQDSYDELLNEYPSTRHIDTATRRLYAIGRSWLGFPDEAKTGEIQLVAGEEPRVKSPESDESASWTDPTRVVPILPNLHDRSRPVFDTTGRALEALKSVWLKDPTGPLADDALMLAASHYIREKNYREARHHYQLLREQFPKSPHLQTAFEVGSHVTLMSYQGAAYDAETLAEAKSLKESLLRQFPDLESRARIEAELAKIELAEAERDWEMVRYHQGRGELVSSAIYCHEIIRKHPRTVFARHARDLLREYAQSEDDVLRGLPARYAEPPELLPVPVADEATPAGDVTSADPPGQVRF